MPRPSGADAAAPVRARRDAGARAAAAADRSSDARSRARSPRVRSCAARARALTVATHHMCRYPPVKDADETSCGEHTDCGYLTLLAQDDVGGLEVRTPTGEWTAAVPVKGALVVVREGGGVGRHARARQTAARRLQRADEHRPALRCACPHPFPPFRANAGDMLERWSNGFVRSTRTACGRTARRRCGSIPFFCNCDWDANVACVETCIDAEHPTQKEPIQAGPYMLEKLGLMYS